jgi:hypothetical protein
MCVNASGKKLLQIASYLLKKKKSYQCTEEWPYCERNACYIVAGVLKAVEMPVDTSQSLYGPKD